jgi:hypothetical protein
VVVIYAVGVASKVSVQLRMNKDAGVAGLFVGGSSLHEPQLG